MIKSFEADFFSNLNSRFHFNNAHLDAIRAALFDTFQEYTISERQTALTVYNGVPMALKKYLATRKVEGLADGTLDNYTRMLKIFVNQVGYDFDSMTEDDIILFLCWYKTRTGKEISNRSLNKVLDCLKSFFGWMHNRELIHRDPTAKVKRMKEEKKQKQPMTEMDVERIRRACITAKEKAFVEILYSTGCRIREIELLKKSDIDFDAKTLRVFGKGSKWRTAYLNVKAELALKEYFIGRSDRNEYAFVSDRAPHNKLTVAALEKALRKVTERAELSVHVTPHVFRHTTAQRLLDRGAPITVVQQVLGHEKIDTTMHYVVIDKSTVQQEHTKYIV